jgi:thiosulfate dehydrogenase [quinone] large subunit
MSVKDHPQEHRNTPVPRNTGTTTAMTTTTAAGAFAAVLRIATGLIFLWAFLDKLLGLGYATPGERAWLEGGSPTKGFLGGIDHGPFAAMFRGWAGAGWADWLFMLGLGAVGFAVVLGIGMRIAAVSGTLMMMLMWAAEWPLARFTDAGQPTMSTNPLIDYHIIYALVLIVSALTAAGNTWGFGRTWATLDIVKKNPWLR